tara:strand:- start:4555 stop:4734 length:180 start_codon:yes stop_codon:yes gene_type:complete
MASADLPVGISICTEPLVTGPFSAETVYVWPQQYIEPFSKSAQTLYDGVEMATALIPVE